jgi:hypothetical protein
MTFFVAAALVFASCAIGSRDEGNSDACMVIVWLILFGMLAVSLFGS